MGPSSDLPVLIVGSGAAGMACALALAPRPVVLLTKAAQAESGSTPWAQGGIAVAIGPGDSPADHALDTVYAGAGLVDEVMARLLTDEGPRAVSRLIADGMAFDTAADGRLTLGREAAHGRDRIVHAGGDRTGAVLAASLAAAVARTPSITVATDCTAVDLILDGNQVRGVLTFGRGGWQVMPAAAVVLATGGWGMAWLETTNPPENTGDGLAMAARAGALLADLEFMQFHPTALAIANENGARLPLLTEALRGAGAVLLDSAGTAFMAAEHPLADLAPRDVVARAVGQRRAAGEAVFLDLRPALAAKGATAFPQVLDACAAAGLDPWTAAVPVAPAAHYAMGGVVTDPAGRSSLSGLWACGEVACTGVHGANRLASNSLLEALVFGHRVADDITRHGLSADQTEGGALAAAIPAVVASADCVRLVAEARALMSRNVGLVRDGAGLAAAVDGLEFLKGQLAALPASTLHTADTVRIWAEARNLLTVAGLVASAAERRQESRGAHCRTDYPDPREVFHRRFTQRLGAPPSAAEVRPAAAHSVLSATLGSLS